jgi:hypothetical protein
MGGPKRGAWEGSLEELAVIWGTKISLMRLVKQFCPRRR